MRNSLNNVAIKTVPTTVNGIEMATVYGTAQKVHTAIQHPTCECE